MEVQKSWSYSTPQGEGKWKLYPINPEQMFANIHKVLGKFEYQDGGKVVERELVGRRLNSCLRYEQTIGWFRMKKTDRLDFLGPKQISAV